MKVEVIVSLNLVGCERRTTIEVEEGTPDAEIEEVAKDAMFEMIEWTWKRVESSPKSKKR